MSLNVGDVVDDKYRIVRLLGEGGMGAVYEGENTRIHRRVAIKVLHQGVAQAQDAVQRFEREAQAAGRIGNEHIVEVLDLGTLPTGDHYMVMEFLDGESLADRIKRQGGLEPGELLPIAVQMLEGLKAAHDVGIIHRDLKPDNVFLIHAKDGIFVKLVDFGISKFSAMGGEFSMTRTGAVMGTPYYMSPEQAKGQRDIDQRVDLYAAGVILYESITGSVPFDAETFNELLFKIVLEEPPPISQCKPDLDLGFATIIDKARAKDPNARYQTAAEFQMALTNWGNSNQMNFVGAQTIATPAAGVPTNLTRGTPDTWSTDGGTEQISLLKNKKAVIAAAAGALVLLLAAGGVVIKMQSDSAAEAAAAQAQEEAEKARQEQEATNAKELEAERLRVEEARAAADKAKAEAEAAKAAAAKSTTALKAQAEAEAERLKKEAEEKAAAVKAAQARQARAQQRVKQQAPAPKPQPVKRTTSQRKIRTEL